MLERTLTDTQASWLTFTGGEPLLYEGLEQVMTFVHQRFPYIRLGLATNGVLLDASRLDQLMEAGLGYVEISLLASRAQTYQRIAGFNHLDRPRRALALARSRGLTTTAAVVLRSGLEPELEDLIRTSHALGADRLALNRFVARGRGAQNPTTFMSSFDELDRMLTLADRLGGELHYSIAITTPIEDRLLPHGRFPHLEFGTCVCGASKWAIDPGGNLRICELDERLLGNLNRNCFDDLARDPRVTGFHHANQEYGCAKCTA
jgi:MoaA/NifB/PqqE/SkfB family radical SAM enzyme